MIADGMEPYDDCCLLLLGSLYYTRYHDIK